MHQGSFMGMTVKKPFFSFLAVSADYQTLLIVQLISVGNGVCQEW